MQSIKKKENHKSEEHFHDEWATSTPIEEVNPFAPFEGKTSPEYKESIKMLGNLKGKKVLNLGSGLGEEAVYLASQGAIVTAIDISNQMLEFTKKLARRYKVASKITCIHMSAEELKFKNESFDAVYGCNLLHHVDLEKTIKEVRRVLKRNGVGVFSEPLAYNPLINVYRVMAHAVRTDHEHPLNLKDIATIKKTFPKLTQKEMHLSTLFIFVWFYIVERKHPNKVRYWKKIIQEGDKYEKPFKVLHSFDNSIMNILPFLKKYCWVILIKIKK